MRINISDDLIQKLYNKEHLRTYQIDAIESIVNSFNNDNKKTIVQLAAGTGVQYVIIKLIEFILQQNGIGNVILLTSRREIAQQLSENLHKRIQTKICNYLTRNHEERIVVTTYTDFSKNYKPTSSIAYTLVICLDAQNSTYGQTEEYLASMNSMFLGCFNTEFTQAKKSFWSDASFVFKYSTIDAIKDGYINPAPDVEQPIIDALSNHFKKFGFSPVAFNSSLKLSSVRNIKPDMFIEDENQFIIIEIKSYRGKKISADVINRAVDQMKLYRNSIIHTDVTERRKPIKCCLILLCEIDLITKQFYYENHDITIWDVSNLIYLFQDDDKYIHILKSTLNFSVISLLLDQ